MNTAVSDQTCVQCGLSGRVPGVSFDTGGVCQYCRSQARNPLTTEQKTFWKEKFLEYIRTMPRDGEYDCLVSYSGGKDSTYTLLMLAEEYRLRTLAVVFDQGFISGRAKDNIRTITGSAGIDCHVVQPSFTALRDLFAASLERDLYSPKALERTSAICVSCMSLIKGTMFSMAIEKRIPLIAYGWSPGQAGIKSSLLKLSPELVRAVQTPIREAIRSVIGDKLDAFFIQPRHFADTAHFPLYVHPLAFEEYDEEKIFARIAARGWVKPGDTDFTSTNCLLNSFANARHIERHGYHPYAHEYAGLVRQNILDREEAERRMADRGSETVMEMVRERLNLRGAEHESSPASELL